VRIFARPFDCFFFWHIQILRIREQRRMGSNLDRCRLTYGFLFREIVEGSWPSQICFVSLSSHSQSSRREQQNES
jgi:hypothetical protein